MDLTVVRKMIQKHVTGHGEFLKRAMTADRYYNNLNDILFAPSRQEREAKGDIENPMRTADNRIPMSFYSLLVEQKVSYLFTAPPVFDSHNDDANKVITNALGGSYASKIQELATNASNAGIGWLHYWIDENGEFQYAVVPSEEIIPIWSPKLSHDLLAVLRVYREYDDNGDAYKVYEYWNDRECEAYRVPESDETMDRLFPYGCFIDFYNAGLSEADNQFIHNFGRVPFIPFRNNQRATSDLDKIKKLIDAYDKTLSGFMNDL